LIEWIKTVPTVG